MVVGLTPIGSLASGGLLVFHKGMKYQRILDFSSILAWRILLTEEPGEAVVLPRPARGAGTLIPSAQRFVWAAKKALGKAALGTLFA